MLQEPEIKILDDDSDGIQILGNRDVRKLAMSLDEIHTQEDLELWREHNVEVAAYLSDYLRNVLFEEGSVARNLFLSSRSPLPEEIRAALEFWDGLYLGEREGGIDLELDLEPAAEDESFGIVVYDESHPKVRSLRAMENGEELNTEVVHWVADYLGVPLIINYTAENFASNGVGGHAQALVRTPYQLDDGSWAYDVMDPMVLEPKLGIKLRARSKEAAFEELSEHMSSNVIGGHLLEHRVDFNLLEKMSGTPSYDLLLSYGTSRLQEKDVVNCQFMSLLIQSYLWAYYGSFHDFSAGSIPDVSVGDVITKRFQEVFNVSMKQIFNVMEKVPPFDVEL